MPELPKEVTEVWTVVRDQAESHTTRDQGVRIMSKYRPNRTERVVEYQQANYRALSMGEFRKVKTKLSRVIRSNGVTVKAEGAKLAEWLASRPFLVLHQAADLWSWVYEEALSTSLEDPNAVCVPLPYYTENVAPAAPVEVGGLPENEIPKVQVEIVLSKDIRFISKDLLVWVVGTKYIDRRGYFDIYMAVDKSGFYQVIPELEKDKVVYTTELWYRHVTEGALFSIMPGNISRTGKWKYNESVAHPFFEYADEFIAVFQDSQSVSVEHIYPKTIVSGNLPCPEDGCINGKIKVTHGTGHELKVCKTCKGTGEITNPGPFGYLKRPRSEKDNAPPPIEYLYPSTEIVKISYDRAFDLLLKAKQSMGLDLIGQIAESGTAKLYRLEDLEDMIQAYAGGLFDMVRIVLERVEEILEINESERMGVSYTLPSTFNVSKSSVDTLSKEFKEAHQAVRLPILQQLVESKYGDDPEMKYKVEVAARAAVLFLSTNEEQQMAVGMGIAEADDILRAGMALGVIDTLTLTYDLETDVQAAKTALDGITGSGPRETPID
jgi:hypothetical protein